MRVVLDTNVLAAVLAGRLVALHDDRTLAEYREVLASILRDGTTEAVRLRAAEALLERAWGKPSQPVEDARKPAESAWDMSRLTDDELQELTRMGKKATGPLEHAG